MLWEAVFLNPIAGPGPHAAGLAAGLAADAAPKETLMDSEAFAAFYQRSAKPELSLAEGEVAARRYLFRIATNLMRDHWRRPAAASIEEMPEEFFAAADRSGQRESQAILGPALRQMRPRDRQLLWLAHAEGYSHHEIAQITGLGSASIRLLLFRARRKIARILLAQAQGPETAQQPATGFRSQL